MKVKMIIVAILALRLIPTLKDVCTMLDKNVIDKIFTSHQNLQSKTDI